MPLTTHHKRLEASQSAKFRRYFWYAIGEILLIFSGITLALWFGNWNEERQLHGLETLALTEIVADLKANVDHIYSNIDKDTLDIEACERFLNTLSRREPWQDAYAKDLDQCRWWSSPFLSSAAYESLKSRGTDLITDPSLRNAIVNLYEQTYAFLVEDIDKGFWALQTSVVLPVLNRHVRYVEPNQLFPNDYETLLDSDEFMNMLRLKMDTQKVSILIQQETLVATEKAIGMIETQLLQQAL